MASLIAEHKLEGMGAQWLWHKGLTALQHVGSSQIKGQTHVPCMGRQILNHWTTREVLNIFKLMSQKFLFPRWISLEGRKTVRER